MSNDERPVCPCGETDENALVYSDGWLCPECIEEPERQRCTHCDEYPAIDGSDYCGDECERRGHEAIADDEWIAMAMECA